MSNKTNGVSIVKLAEEGNAGEVLARGDNGIADVSAY